MLDRLREGGGGERVAALRSALQNTMDLNSQVYRTEATLKQAEADIAVLKQRYRNVTVQDKGRRFNTDLLEAVENSAVVAVRLDFTLEDLGYDCPKDAVPRGESMDSFLSRVAFAGARGRYSHLIVNVVKHL